MRLNVACCALFVCISMVSVASAKPVPRVDYDLILEDVTLRPGVTADINVKVFVNEDTPCRAKKRAAVVVHGYGHSAGTWEAFAQAAFQGTAGPSFCRIAAVDMPGAGSSAPPTGPTGLIFFSELLLQDYTTALIETLERLPAAGFKFDTLIGHSQGAMLVQLAQQRLVASGGSLGDYGISEAVLLAPVPPDAVDWYFVTSGNHLTLLGDFCQPPDPMPCEIVDIPGAAWPFLFFTNFLGDVSPATPDVVPTLNAWASPEPLVSSLELTGEPPFDSRPVIDEGIFAGDDVALTVVGFEQDVLVLAGEAVATYVHLTGDGSGEWAVTVAGPTAIHDMYISEPQAVVDALGW